MTIVASVPNVLVINVDFAEEEQHQQPGRPDRLRQGQSRQAELRFGRQRQRAAFVRRTAEGAHRRQYRAHSLPGRLSAQLALLSGQSDFMFDNLAASAPLIKDGKVKALAVTTRERSSLLPDVPTVEQSGVKNFDLGTWFGVFTTGGTPPAVVDKLNKAYSAALMQPGVRQRLLTMGSRIKPMSPTQFADFVHNEKNKYKEIVQVSGASTN